MVTLYQSKIGVTLYQSKIGVTLYQSKIVGDAISK